MFLIPCGNHAQLGGGSVAERLMSTLAYGWVEHCSEVAGCGILHQKISDAGYFISAIISIVLPLYIDVLGIMNPCVMDYAYACMS